MTLKELAQKLKEKVDSLPELAQNSPCYINMYGDICFHYPTANTGCIELPKTEKERGDL
jgi:hypothetical protein